MRKLTVVSALFGVTLVGCLLHSAADAATIDTVLTVTATDFGPGTSPYETITGTFDITYDPAQTYLSATGLVTGYSFSTTPEDPASPPPPFGFSDAPSTLEVTYQPGGSFQIMPAGFFSGPSQKFDFVLNDAFATPALSFFAYVPADGALPYQSQGSSVTFSFDAPVAATPIPPALPLFASALGGLGFVGWRRNKAATA
jgi:hypothetical protein